MTRGHAIALVGILLAWSPGCSGGSDATGPTGPATVALTTAADTLRSIGEAMQVTAIVKDRDGAILTATVSWSSANASVASVSTSGVVTAKDNGTTRITATAGTASASVTVVVRQSPASVTITPDTVRLAFIGATTGLAASVEDAGGTPLTNPPIVWTSSNAGVASIGASGMAQAKSNGVATIIATAGTARDSVTLRVEQVPAHVAITPSAIRLTSLNATLPLTATVNDSGGTAIAAVAITWVSTNPAAATISPAGVLTAVGFDTTTIHAAAGSAADTAAVLVTPVAALSLVAPAPEANEGTTLQLSANLTDAAGGPLVGHPVTWVSDSAHVATVDGAGLVSALRPGLARIRLHAAGLADTLDLPVRGLRHRWTFSEEGGVGTVFVDDLGGTLARFSLGGTQPGAALGGMVTLAGGPLGTAQYVEMPPGLFRDKADATIEVWGTLHSETTYSSIFQVGPSSRNYLFITWSNGTTPAFDWLGFGVNGVQDAIIGAVAPFTPDLQHHLVVTVDEGGGAGGKTRVEVYKDGQFRSALETTHRLQDLTDSVFLLGASGFSQRTANASYDEVRLHDRALTGPEIWQSYVRGPVRSGSSAILDILPPIGIRDTIRGVGVRFPLRSIGRDGLGRQFPVPTVGWSSSDTSIATVDTAGVVHTRAPGQVQITATAGSVTAQWTAEVVRIRRLTVDPYLATPASGALWEVPVILIEYLPTSDGIGLDTLKAPDFWSRNPVSLDSMEAYVLNITKRRKMMVEEGSRFRGYKDPTALPSLGYRVVEHFIVYDQIPPHPTKRALGNIGQPRYEGWHEVFAELGLDPIMRAQGVRELWVAWSSFDGGTPSYLPGVFNDDDMRAGWESNMASPTTWDISNSDRDVTDAPILSHTYIIYGINFRRSQAEAVHNVGHQLEHMLWWVADQQDGHSRLFWHDFVGQDSLSQFITGRAGWTHMPPNTTNHYDYLNPTQVLSDIEDWRPDNAGQKKLVNVDTWGNLVYPWPGAPDFGQRVESQWYTYWFQNFPGRGNQIPHGQNWMTNWWAFVADWDAAVTSGLGLHAGTQAAVAGTGTLPAGLTSVRTAPPPDDDRERIPPRAR